VLIFCPVYFVSCLLCPLFAFPSLWAGLCPFSVRCPVRLLYFLSNISCLCWPFLSFFSSFCVVFCSIFCPVYFVSCLLCPVFAFPSRSNLLPDHSCPPFSICCPVRLLSFLSILFWLFCPGYVFRPVFYPVPAILWSSIRTYCFLFCPGWYY
jgi:hypothetical protein